MENTSKVKMTQKEFDKVKNEYELALKEQTELHEKYLSNEDRPRDILNKYLVLKQRLEYLTKKLDNIEVIEEVIPNNNPVELGTKFNATLYLKEGLYTNDFIFLEEDGKNNDGYSVIETNSPIGRSIMGIHENEEFFYRVGLDRIKGIVNKVYSLEENKTLKKTINN